MKYRLDCTLMGIQNSLVIGSLLDLLCSVIRIVQIEGKLSGVVVYIFNETQMSYLERNWSHRFVALKSPLVYVKNKLFK